MRIAYVSPLPPIRTGIADYSEELLPHLAAHMQVDLFVNGYLPESLGIREKFQYFDSRELRQRFGSYDAVVYQIGNSPYHADAFRFLPEVPGISVLHDYVLHHAIVELTVARGNAPGYIREMGYCYGAAGAELARQVLRSGCGFPYEQFPLNQRILDASLGLIVHSRYVRELVRILAPELPVAVIPHHVISNPEPLSPPIVRHLLGLPVDRLLFGAFGLATPPKRLDVALRAFARLREREVDACFLIVGDIASENDLKSVISQLQLESAVYVTGYVDKVDLIRYIGAVDVGISLRWPTMGETSGTLMRLLSAGKPTIVSDVGAFAELPAECVWKVPVGDEEEDRIFDAMISLARDREIQYVMGQRARSYVREHHQIERSAAAYVAFIHLILNSSSVEA